MMNLTLEVINWPKKLKTFGKYFLLANSIDLNALDKRWENIL